MLAKAINHLNHYSIYIFLLKLARFLHSLSQDKTRPELEQEHDLRNERYW
jgi:hypothetical protein